MHWKCPCFLWISILYPNGPERWRNAHRWVRSILMSFDVRFRIKVEEPVINCYIIIGVQISTSVSLVLVKTVDDVWMASMNTHVTVLQDGQELTVNSVSWFGNGSVAFWSLMVALVRIMKFGAILRLSNFFDNCMDYNFVIMWPHSPIVCHNGIRVYND